jgi:hypothetical protein
MRLYEPPACMESIFTMAYPENRPCQVICRHATAETLPQLAFNYCMKKVDDLYPRLSAVYASTDARPRILTRSRQHCRLYGFIAYGRSVESDYKIRPLILNETLSSDSLATMFATKHLIFATAFAFQAAALSATEPIDEAKECWTSWEDYRSSSEWYQYQSTTELVSTEEFVSTSVDSDVPLTTLCDGKARALEPYKTAVITETETLESPTPTTFTRDYTEPSPTCSIGESACSSLIYTHDLNQRHCTLAKTYPGCVATSAPCAIQDDGHSTLVSGCSRSNTPSVYDST